MRPEKARPPGRRTKGVAGSAVKGPQIATIVTDLDGYRRRRLLCDLRLDPVPVCTGICYCWGAPLGGSA
jgi:hypothetical protein